MTQNHRQLTVRKFAETAYELCVGKDASHTLVRVEGHEQIECSPKEISTTPGVYQILTKPVGKTKAEVYLECRQTQGQEHAPDTNQLAAAKIGEAWHLHTQVLAEQVKFYMERDKLHLEEIAAKETLLTAMKDEVRDLALEAKGKSNDIVELIKEWGPMLFAQNGRKLLAQKFNELAGKMTPSTRQEIAQLIHDHPDLQ